MEFIGTTSLKTHFEVIWCQVPGSCNPEEWKENHRQKAGQTHRESLCHPVNTHQENDKATLDLLWEEEEEYYIAWFHKGQSCSIICIMT